MIFCWAFFRRTGAFESLSNPEPNEDSATSEGAFVTTEDTTEEPARPSKARLTNKARLPSSSGCSEDLSEVLPGEFERGGDCLNSERPRFIGSVVPHFFLLAVSRYRPFGDF